MSSIFTNIFTGLAKALTSVAGVTNKINTIEAIAEADLISVAQGTADYEAGKAVVLGTLSEGGKSGKIVAVADGGEASKALGLS